MRIAFLTGAGMSAESGVPTFRDALTGLWARFDAERLATEAAFRDDPALVWGWYRWRAARVRRARPNAGHHGIAALARDHDVRVVTQNVDDLHERAGSRDVAHLHGSLFASRCIDCGATACEGDDDGAREDPILRDADAVPDEGGREAPPHCAACGGAFRPGVVWFGESLPERAWNAAIESIGRSELVVVVGTSGLVHPAAALPGMAREAGKRIIEVNPQRSAITALADEHYACGAGEGLARLQRELAS